MSAYKEDGLMSWNEFVEQRVKPHFDKLDAWDTTILKSIHTRFTQLYKGGRSHPTLAVERVMSDAIRDGGFITDEEFSKRLKKLEDLALVIRKIRLN